MMSSTSKVLRISGVSKQFPAAHAGAPPTLALDGVSLDVAASEVVSIVGPSGCGKSTLLRMAAGFEAPSRGTVEFGGRPVAGPSAERGIVFQQPALFPWLTVRENIVFGPKMRGEPRVRYEALADELVGAVQLDGFERHFPYQLSGGMRQRAQIARVLITRPDILLMDEPFGALDFQTRLSMQRLVVSLRERFDQSILFITHDVDEAIFLSDRIFVMRARPGRIEQVFTLPFGRSRHYASIARSPEAAEIKLRILSLLGYVEEAGP